MIMETEKEIIRDIWIYLKTYNDPPAIGSDACVAFWEKAAKDIADLIAGKWDNHPLATKLGIAVYAYLENKSRKGRMDCTSTRDDSPA